MISKIQVSVIVVTKNEAARIARCLESLVHSFDDVWVLDSNSTDNTMRIASGFGAQVVNFEWDGQYPKKRQWALDTLDLKYNRIFFVDADEIVTKALTEEIAALDWSMAGYFISARYRLGMRLLKFGLQNKKLCLFDRTKVHFPEVDDLDIQGMGEIEGHYQPVLKADFRHEKIGCLRNMMIHDAFDNTAHWQERHERYADWEAGMLSKNSWPKDPCSKREILKHIFRQMPHRPAAAFLHSYIFKGGILDGRAGYHFAQSRAQYYRMIQNRLVRKNQ